MKTLKQSCYYCKYIILVNAETGAGKCNCCGNTVTGVTNSHPTKYILQQLRVKRVLKAWVGGKFRVPELSYSDL